MDFLKVRNELKTLHSIFSSNEERVNQLEQREKMLKDKLGEESNG